VNAALEQQVRWIGQELHDEAGQFLTAAYIALEEAVADASPASRERLGVVRRHLESIEEELRRLAHELRPRILDDFGLIAALAFLAEGVERRRGIPVTLVSTVDQRLPAPVETAIYRFAQEACTNITRHARASQVTIHLALNAGELRCRITDNGSGFDMQRVDRGRLGLSGIRDRLEILAGALQVNTRPGGGTELVATVPLETHDACPRSAGRRSSNCA
jgi:signal transduction histidine kinase